MKGILYPEGSIINQGLMLIILLMSLKETYEYIRKPDNSSSSIYFRGLSILIFMYIIYGIILFLTDGMSVDTGWNGSYPTMYYMEGALVTLLPIYTCYSYSRKGYITKDLMQKWVLVFLIIAICEYYKLQREGLERLLRLGRNIDGITNNAGYVLLSLIPGLLLFNEKGKRYMLYVGLAICVFFIMSSMKRGAILIGAISVAIIVWENLKNAKGFSRIAVVLVAIIAVSLISRYVNIMLENSDYFNSRLQATLEGDASERDEIYSNYWNAFLHERNVLIQLFGRGGMGTLKMYGVYAHNDWLEILTGNGLIGVGIFAFYWLRFIKTVRTGVFSQESRFCLLLLLCIFGLKSCFSMSITGMPIFATSIMGFALADGFRNIEYTTE